uniref:Phosphoglycolate phosphatase, HAD superfamily n=1 Tax=Candidatus Kentrum sp. TUN TaxID=2126343 RepID=A0A450ZRF2_9GAMM|nr:MAG: Phosphoglycolate phosphatase, HAD superfamily [Candidatus Kentron sp. TUN]VFK60031.1 MAG: Phosphoglycolate phosphatase, HAD superfamily [Candidatus Kentron sp. TUN]VFK69298.1 MAG: Phosphoglycolate phosphatase, HAD superfamily [Candidatus Kentron sp. TUN]
MTLLALDFDGVLCDSMRETAVSGWKAGAMIWPDMPDSMPPDTLLAAYGVARPIVETGYEAILVMRLLKTGRDPLDLLDSFPEHKARLMTQIGRDQAELNRLYGLVRDRRIADDPHGWSAMSPLYPGIKWFLHNLPTSIDSYIITTKQERFVRQLLDYNGVEFPSERIFGLDRRLFKEAILLDLLTHHPNRRLYFIEDRLATLVRIMEHANLATVRLYLADWGYNTHSNRESARELKIPILDLCGLLALTFLEDDK